MAAETAETPKRRSAGILLHPTSLPGRYGIGDLGPLAFAWVEALARAKQTWWQILPLGPTGYGDSPYQSYSPFAGNPNLVSPDLLAREGLVTGSDLDGTHFAADRVDYDNVTKFKNWLLDRAWQAFKAGAAGHLRAEFDQFQREEAHWLDDFALFMAVKESQGGRSWQEWPANVKRREPAALERAAEPWVTLQTRSLPPLVNPVVLVVMPTTMVTAVAVGRWAAPYSTTSAASACATAPSSIIS